MLRAGLWCNNRLAGQRTVLLHPAPLHLLFHRVTIAAQTAQQRQSCISHSRGRPRRSPLRLIFKLSCCQVAGLQQTRATHLRQPARSRRWRLSATLRCLAAAHCCLGRRRCRRCSCQYHGSGCLQNLSCALVYASRRGPMHAWCISQGSWRRLCLARHQGCVPQVRDAH